MSNEDLKQSEHRFRAMLLALLILLLCVLVAAALQSYVAPYRKLQRAFAASYSGSLQPPSGIRSLAVCGGEKERCLTCHLGIDRPDLASENILLPFRFHGPGIGKHDPYRVGCTVCHGGEGRALDPKISHASLTVGEPDPLMKAPHIEAACAKCHIIGAKKGQERLLEGAKLYAGLGCPICHPLSDQGTGGFDFGPDLRASGRLSINYLKTSLMDPSANFPGSTMPSFKLALEKKQHAFESLIIYLESLPLPRQKMCADRKKSAVRVDRPCTDCHAGPSGRASGRIRHRCPYIIEKKAELRCAGCHEKGIPESTSSNKDCPFILRHREACPVCHDSSGTPSPD